MNWIFLTMLSFLCYRYVGIAQFPKLFYDLRPKRTIPCTQVPVEVTEMGETIIDVYLPRFRHGHVNLSAARAPTASL